MARDSFIFYRSFYEAIKEVPAEAQLQIYKAISIYALEQEEIELSGIAKAIFSLVKPQLDANYKKYENGKQTKSKSKAKNKQNESKTGANVNDNENVNVNVNVNDNAVGESCVDGLQDVIDFYSNNIGLMTPYVLKILESYLDEGIPAELITYAMQKAVESNKRTFQYIKGILNSWSKKGIKTLIQAKEEEQEFKQEKQSKTEKRELVGDWDDD